MNWSDLSCSLNPTWPDWLPEAAALPTVLAAAGLLVALTLWTYLGTRGARFGRILTVMLLRLGALVVALVVALRPSLGMQVHEGLVPSRFYIIVDASGSMGITDDFDGLSRWDNACRILSATRVRDALRRLADDEKIEAIKYQAAEGLADFNPDSGPHGKRTDIGTWLHELHAKSAGQGNLRGVLIFSDGADNGTRYPTLDEARRFKGICPVYTFGHGKAQDESGRKDIAVSGIRAVPSPVPAKTKLKVTGTIQAPGFKDEMMVKVSLWIQGPKDSVPQPYGKVEDHLLKGEKNNEVTLTRDAPETPDEYKLTLKVARVEGESDESNNEASTYLQVTKEGVRVLWIEQRKWFESSFVLRYALGGDKRIRADYLEIDDHKTDLPRIGLDQGDPDVIVIGDLSAQQFAGGDRVLLELVRDLVREKKVGLMMLGGIDTFGKGGWGKTPLADVLPAKFDTQKQIDTPAKVLPVEKGVDVALYPFMMLDPDPEKNKQQWKKFGKLDGMAPLGAIDKGAVELATMGGEPILVAGQPGHGGRVLVFGGDTTFKAWRRPGTVENYDKFWRQAILWLANQDDRAGSLWVDLKTRRVLAGSPDRLDFRFGFKSKRNKEIAGAQFTVVAEGPGNQKFNIRPEPGKDGQRGTLAAPSIPGEYLLKIGGKGKDETGAAVADEKAVRFLVIADNVELQRKAPDHDHLKDIADKADGRFYHADEADLLKLLGELKGQARRESHTRTIHWPDWDRHPASETVPDQLAGLWGSTAMLWFVAFAALLCTEWGLRRHWGMV